MPRKIYFPIYGLNDRVVKSSNKSINFHGLIVGVVLPDEIPAVLKRIKHDQAEEFKKLGMTIHDWIRAMQQIDKDCLKLPFYLVQPDNIDQVYCCMESDLLPEIFDV